MGDPKRIRKKFDTPSHPWVASRIEEERAIHREYGLKNKREIWKMVTKLTGFKDRAKKLLALTSEQSAKEKEQLLSRMGRLGLISPGSTFDDILGLGIKDLMDRRLQTIIVKRSLARTSKQARQMITHRHITVGGKVVTSPAYLVSIDEEQSVAFVSRSAFFNEQHPERFSEEELQRRKEREEAKQSKKTEEKEDALTFDEASIEEAEVLTGEKKEAKKAKESVKDEPAKAAPADEPAKAAKIEPTAEPSEEPAAAAEIEKGGDA